MFKKGKGKMLKYVIKENVLLFKKKRLSKFIQLSQKKFISKHDAKNQQQPIMLQQYLISIDARLGSRNSTVSVKAEIAECLIEQDSIIA